MARRVFFSFHYERTVNLDNTIAFGGLRLPLPPSPTRRHYARAQVEVEMRRVVGEMAGTDFIPVEEEVPVPRLVNGGRA